MGLTASQLVTLNTDILVTNIVTLQPYVAAIDDQGIADWYNALAVPDFWVWKTNAAVGDIFDAVLWANFTPADAPDNTATWTNRSLACQGKQFNLQTMLLGRTTIDASKPQWRTGLQDALTALPSGAGGANRSGGWAGVATALMRQAWRIEKLFATGTGSVASPATMVVEGTLNYLDVARALRGVGV